MLSFRNLALGAYLVGLFDISIAAPSPSPTPIPPSKDPWYTAPSGFEKASAGQILRVRHAPGNLTSIWNNTAAVYNLLFRTVDTNYQPAWAVTTLFVPKQTHNEAHSNVCALLSYQIPYNTDDVDGSPSYLFHTSFGSAGLIFSDIYAALSNGWYVNVPDFEGPRASFLDLVQEGVAVLDSLRAVMHDQAGPSPSARLALWGYSGGSYASTAASELQTAYAPELSISGLAIGGVPANFTTTLALANKGIFAGLIPEGFLGLTSQYQQAREVLLFQLKPNYRQKFLRAENLSIEAAFTVYNGTDFDEFFVYGLAGLLATPPFPQLIGQHATLGYHGIPASPVFLYKAVHDELAPIAQSDALVDRWCGVAVDVLSERNSVGGHLAEETNGDARALAWLKGIFAGTNPSAGCTIRNVSIGIDPSPI